MSMRRLLMAEALFMIASLTFGIGEEDFAQQYKSLVRPYYKSGDFGYFTGIGGVKIAYAAYERPDERGALVILSGKSGAHVHYAEFIYDVRDWGYSVYVMDHRGMGFSGRMLEDPQKTHVQNFANYVKDAKTFVDTVVQRTPHERLFLFAHSMGAAVAALYLEQFDHDFSAAVFNCPMFGLNTGATPEAAVGFLTSLLRLFGQGAEYAPGQGPWQLVNFEENALTHSQVRYRRWEENDIGENPEITPGGVTNSWASQCIRHARKAWRKAGEIQIPVLILQADDDAFVTTTGQNRFCKRAPNCTKVVFPGSRHILFIESDPVRNQMLARVQEFFASHLASIE